MTKELMVCTCGNSKNEIYAELKELKIQKIFIKCPKCGKESLVAHLEEKVPMKSKKILVENQEIVKESVKPKDIRIKKGFSNNEIYREGKCGSCEELITNINSYCHKCGAKIGSWNLE